MRMAFMRELTRSVKRNPRVILVTGDLGFSVYDEFQKLYPKQYLNAGVAEQNMTGVAAGMAAEGMIPIVYSLSPFVTMRNYEEVRNDICYDNRNVKIVGVGGGFSYGFYGHTHYGLEDIALMRTLPNMTIFSPGDPVEVAWATREAIRIKGPCYIRLGKVGEPVVHKQSQKFALGRGIVMRKGENLTIIATGVLLPRALEVADVFAKEHITTRVVSMHTIKPIDRELVITSAEKTKVVCTLEEHFIDGGLGGAVAEVLAESGIAARFRRFGVTEKYFHKTGSQEYMRSLAGLTTQQLVSSIRSFVGDLP